MWSLAPRATRFSNCIRTSVDTTRLGRGHRNILGRSLGGLGGVGVGGLLLLKQATCRSFCFLFCYMMSVELLTLTDSREEEMSQCITVSFTLCFCS